MRFCGINVPCSVNFTGEIKQAATNYWNKIPPSKHAIGMGFAVGMLKGSFITGHLVGGLACGTAAAVATSIYSLVTPLFKSSGQEYFTVRDSLIIRSISLLGGFATGALMGYLPSSFLIKMIAVCTLMGAFMSTNSVNEPRVIVV